MTINCNTRNAEIATGTLIDQLSNYNTFKVFHSENPFRTPNPFMCYSIEFQTLFGSTYIVFKRGAVSDVELNKEIISFEKDVVNDRTVVFTIHTKDDSSTDDKIKIEATRDNDIFVPVKLCTINKSNFSINDGSAFEFLMNPQFLDIKRTKTDKEFYVIDINRLGIMTFEQKYMVNILIRYLEMDCYHNVLKTICCFMNGQGLLEWHVYDLENNKVL